LACHRERSVAIQRIKKGLWPKVTGLPRLARNDGEGEGVWIATSLRSSQ